MSQQARLDAVRQALAAGKFDEAVRLLGEPADTEAFNLAGLAQGGLR